jgi:hypothetical protein
MEIHVQGHLPGGSSRGHPISLWVYHFASTIAIELTQEYSFQVYDHDTPRDERSECLAEYKRYLASRLRSRLEKRFDEAVLIFEKDMKTRAIDAIVDVQLDILNEFRQSTGKGGTQHSLKSCPADNSESSSSPPREMPNIDETCLKDFQFSVEDLSGLEFLGSLGASEDFALSGADSSRPLEACWMLFPEEYGRSISDSGYESTNVEDSSGNSEL